MASYNRQQWKILIGASFLQFCSGLNTSLEAPFYPREAEKKGCTAPEFGLVMGCCNIATCFTCLLCEKLLDKFSAHSVFNWGNYVAALSTILFGYTDYIQDYGWFFGLCMVLSCLQGIGYATMMISTSAILEEHFSNTRTEIFSNLELIYGLGLIIGPAMGSILYSIGGFTLPFVVNGIMMLVSAIYTHIILPKFNYEIVTREASEKSFFWDIFKIKEVLAALACTFSFGFANGFIQSTVEPTLRIFRLNSFFLGAVFVLKGLVYTAATPLLNWINIKIQRPHLVLLFGMFNLVIAFCLLGPPPFQFLKPSLELVILALVLNDTGQAASNIAVMPVAFNACCSRRQNSSKVFSTVSILIVSLYDWGLFLGSLLGGVLPEAMGFRNATVIVISLQIVIGIISTITFFFKKPIIKITMRRKLTFTENDVIQEVEMFRNYGSVRESIETG